MNEEISRILQSTIHGAAKGGPLGAILSVASGAAVIVTIPAWVPFVATGVAISTAAVATGALIGAVVGGAAGGVNEKLAIDRENEAFKEDFNL